MTNLVPRHPFRLITGDFDSLRRTIDRILDGPIERPPRRLTLDRASSGLLTLDISERDGEIIVRAAVPGFARDDIDVQLHDGVLSITARRSEQNDEQTDQRADDQEHRQDHERYYRREIPHGAVNRRIALPRTVHDAEVDAALADGVLTVTISVTEQPKPRQIEIRAA